MKPWPALHISALAATVIYMKAAEPRICKTQFKGGQINYPTAITLRNSVTPIYSPERRQVGAFVRAVRPRHGIWFKLPFQVAKHSALQPNGLHSLAGFVTAARVAGIRPKARHSAVLSLAFLLVGLACHQPIRLRFVFSWLQI
jgi:hypothetical protein